MTDAFDRELVALALERGFITSEKVEECRRLQALPPGDKALPQILLERGYLTMLQFTDMFASAESRAGESGWFGRIAVDLGFVKESQVVEALAEQADWAPTEDRLRLGQILLNKGSVTLDQFIAVLRRQGKHVMRCDLCGTRYNVVGWSEGRRAPCRACGCDMRLAESNLKEPVRGTIAAEPWNDATTKIQKAPPRPAGGTTFGRYRLLEEVGRGGMGVVYRAHDPQLDRELAIKILRAGETATEREIQRFHRESRSIAKLQHRNIITIHDVGSEGGLHFFAMDFIHGEPLSQFLQRGPRDLRRRVEVLRDVADALDHAHRQGVIHRDVKPANILVERGGRPIVMDFGLAKDADGGTMLTQDGTQFGTPWFMSPEQVRGDVAAIGPASDVYGLGVILYLMLADRLPFGGKSVGEVYTQVLNKDPPPIGGDAPRDLETICLRAIEKDAARRTATARALADDLGRWLDGVEIATRPSGIAHRIGRRLRRRKAVAALATALTLTVAASVIWSITRERGYERRVRALQAVGKAPAEFLLGRFDEVERLADVAIAEAPDQAAGHFWKARVELARHLATRPLPETRIEQGIVTLAPSPPESEEARLHREEATRLFGVMASLGQEGLEGWEHGVGAGLLAMVEGRYAGASEALRAADPSDIQATLARAFCDYALGRFDEAATEAASILKTPFSGEGQALLVRALIGRAMTLELVGRDPLPAYEEARRAARNDPRLEAAVRVAAGRFFKDHGKGDVARGEFETAIAALKPWPQEASDAHLELAKLLESRGEIDAARTEFASAVQCAEGDAVFARLRRARALTGRMLFRHGRGEPAEDDRAAAIAEYEALGAIPEAAIGLATVLLDHDEAVARLDAASSDDPRILLARGELLGRRGQDRSRRGLDPSDDFKRAVDDLSAALQRHADFATGTYERGHVHLYWAAHLNAHSIDPTQRFELAERDLLGAIRINGTDPWPRLLLASLRGNQAMYAMRRGADPTEFFRQAVGAHHEALAINSEDAHAHASLGQTYSNWGVRIAERGGDPAGTYRLAVRSYTQALRLNPRLPAALRGRAQVRIADEDFGRALDDLHMAPPDAETLQLVGTTRLKRGYHAEAGGGDPTDDYKAAVEALEASIAARPDFVLALTELASVRIQWGRRRGGDKAMYRAAIDACERALSVDAASAEAFGRRGMARANLVEAGEDPALLAEAEADLTQSLGLRPHADAYRFRALVRLNRSNWKGAIEDGETAIEMNPGLRDMVEPILRLARQHESEF